MSTLRASPPLTCLAPLLVCGAAACTLVACGPADVPDTADTADADTDTDTDTDTDSDTDADADTDTDTDTAPGGSGLLRFAGTATVLDTYAGTDTVVFLADDGAGEELCRVTLTLASTGPRTDCVECEWAFTVEVTGATLDVDLECAAVGWDAPDALVGTTRGYGFVPDYFGHAPVLLQETTGTWEPGGYATYDAGTGAFTYEREDGYHPW